MVSAERVSSVMSTASFLVVPASRREFARTTAPRHTKSATNTVVRRCQGGVTRQIGIAHEQLQGG